MEDLKEDCECTLSWTMTNTMNIQDKIKETEYKLSHIKCAKCGKIAYVPYIPNKDQILLGIYSYTCYVNSYLHYDYGWHTLKNIQHSHLCPRCYNGEVEFDIFDKKWYDIGLKYEKERKKI